MIESLPIYYTRILKSLLDRVCVFAKGRVSRGVGFTWYDGSPRKERLTPRLNTPTFPGTQYEGIQFRRSLLDTIPVVGEELELGPKRFVFSHLFARLFLVTGLRLDKLAHQVIPHHPVLRPHVRMLHHFRFILPLWPKDGDGLTPLHYYDSGIQSARNSGEEPTEVEYIRSMSAAREIKRV